MEGIEELVKVLTFKYDIVMKTNAADDLKITL
jgi:hypothetical protein